MQIHRTAVGGESHTVPWHLVFDLGTDEVLDPLVPASREGNKAHLKPTAREAPTALRLGEHGILSSG